MEFLTQYTMTKEQVEFRAGLQAGISCEKIECSGKNRVIIHRKENYSQFGRICH